MMTRGKHSSSRSINVASPKGMGMPHVSFKVVAFGGTGGISTLGRPGGGGGGAYSTRQRRVRHFRRQHFRRRFANTTAAIAVDASSMNVPDTVNLITTSTAAAAAVAASTTQNVEVVTTAISATAASTIPTQAAAAASWTTLAGLRLKAGAAGGVGACLSHVGGVPFDVVKTRMQQEPEKWSGSTLVNVAQELVETEGVSALTLGLRETATGYFIQGALKYGLYEAFKGALVPTTVTAPVVRVTLFALSAAAAEFVGATALCQFEAARIRAVASADTAKGEDSNGEDDAFSSLTAVYARQVPYTVTSLLTYEQLTSVLYHTLAPDAPPAAFIGVRVASAAGAAFIGAITSQPGDTLLTIINSRTGDSHAKNGSKSSSDIVQRVAQAEAARARGASLVELASILKFNGLFLGLRARFPHVLSIVLVQLVVYDSVRELLGLSATGR